MKTKWMASSCIAFVMAASPFADEVAKDSVLMQALRDELARSMEELQLEDAEKPYFLAYRVFENATSSATASLGGLLNVNDGVNRQLVVELRVGDYDFDNTNFMSLRNTATMLPAVAALTVDDDRASPALLLRAAELRPGKTQLIAENEYQRRGGVGLDLPPLTVYGQRNFRHMRRPPLADVGHRLLIGPGGASVRGRSRNSGCVQGNGFAP